MDEKQRRHEYYLANREEIIDKQKKYYKENQEEVKEKSLKRYHSKRDEILKNNRSKRPVDDWKDDEAMAYARTPRGNLVKKYANMKRRSNDPTQIYVKPEDLCTRDEFLDFGLNNKEYMKLFNIWKDSGFQRHLVPSIDRIDNKVGYRIDNLQFITHSANSSKGNFEKAS